jgi:hypothetical protein
MIKTSLYRATALNWGVLISAQDYAEFFTSVKRGSLSPKRHASDCSA